MAQAALPTYGTVADVLEKKNGSGMRLAGWTIARALLIAPPFMAVGVSWQQALLGAAFASGLITVFTLLRIFDARTTGLTGVRTPYARRVRRQLASSRRYR